MDDWRGPRDHQYERARVLPVLVVGFSQFSMQVDRSHAEVNVDDRAGDPGGGRGAEPPWHRYVRLFGAWSVFFRMGSLYFFLFFPLSVSYAM